MLTTSTADAPAIAQDEPTLLDLRNLVVEFQTRAGRLRAVNDVSLTLGAGRVLAVLGESGSGKSILLRTILGIQPPTARVSGQVLMRGTDLLTLPEKASRRGPRCLGFDGVPESDDRARPGYTVEQQIVETLRRHTQLSPTEARTRTIELLRLVQIPSPEERLKAYPFELSGGMRQRIVIAMALACNPSLLLADEPTTALDVTVQARILELLRELQQQLGMSIVIVTHDVAVAAELADEIAVMYAGRIVESGPVRTVLRSPSHPYTRGLLQANIQPQKERPVAIPGSPPNPGPVAGLLRLRPTLLAGAGALLGVAPGGSGPLPKRTPLAVS